MTESELEAWCREQLAVDVQVPARLVAVSGDASFRRYFRFQAGGRSWIAVDAPPEREDSRPFLDVCARLRAAGIRAPQVLACDLARGWMLQEDFGDTLFREAFERLPAQPLMAQILAVLVRLARDVEATGLPPYDATRLRAEMDLLPDWYLARHRNAPFTDTERDHWQALCQRLIDSALQQRQVFVHRDFHSCNLMYSEGAAPGVIDFQDAVRGPLSYDLVSILLDRYITWPRAQLEQWMETFRLQVAPDIAPEHWRRDCDWMGLQRNLKIVGIFARLAYRDGKTAYLDLIPRFADYVRDVLGRYPELAPYRPLLEPRL